MSRRRTLKLINNNQINQINAMKMFWQILDAMAYINKLGFIHRNLKPSSFIFDQNNNIKITDLETAIYQGIEMIQAIGSPLYMAPQVIHEQNNLTKSCDFWSVGLILYEMLTGRPLIEAKIRYQLSRVHQQYKLGKKVIYPKHFNQRWTQLTNMMVQYDPKKRATFSQVLNKLNNHKQQMLNDIADKIGQDPKNYQNSFKMHFDPAQTHIL